MNFNNACYLKWQIENIIISRFNQYFRLCVNIGIF